MTSTPVGATVIVNGIQQGTTPLEIRLPRKKKGQIIRIESPGYNPVEIRPQRKMSGLTIFGNSLFGVTLGIVVAAQWAMENDEREYFPWGMIGTCTLTVAAFGGLFTFIDSRSGSGYDLYPTDLTVTLTKADGPPRVDRILIDAEDLQNIRWIRIRKD